MSYLNYLQGILTWAEVTSELNYEYGGGTPLVIIRDLQGSVFSGSIVKPIQLEVHTTDIQATKALLDTFVLTYNTSSYIDDFDYVKQFYSTPMVIANFDMVGSNYSSRIIVSGTLIISQNVMSIKRILIDGEPYQTSERIVSYTTTPDNQASNNTGAINSTQVRNANIKLTCSMILKTDTLGNKIRAIREGHVGINNSFVVKIIYNDNDYTETHTMKMISSIINDTNANLPVLTVEFMK